MRAEDHKTVRCSRPSAYRDEAWGHSRCGIGVLVGGPVRSCGATCIGGVATGWLGGRVVGGVGGSSIGVTVPTDLMEFGGGWHVGDRFGGAVPA